MSSWKTWFLVCLHRSRPWALISHCNIYLSGKCWIPWNSTFAMATRNLLTFLPQLQFRVLSIENEVLITLFFGLNCGKKGDRYRCGVCRESLIKWCAVVAYVMYLVAYVAYVMYLVWLSYEHWRTEILSLRRLPIYDLLYDVFPKGMICVDVLKKRWLLEKRHKFTSTLIDIQRDVLKYGVYC